MDLSKFLPNMRATDDAPLTPEELEAERLEAKRERIKFHREHVRNGPRSMNYVTVGQQRRRAARDVASRSRKQNLRFRRDWMDNQRNVAVLRGQLVTVGALESDRTFTPAQVHNAEVGLVGAHGHERPWLATEPEIREAVEKGRSLYFDILAEQARAVKA